MSDDTRGLQVSPPSTMPAQARELLHLQQWPSSEIPCVEKEEEEDMCVVLFDDAAGLFFIPSSSTLEPVAASRGCTELREHMRDVSEDIAVAFGAIHHPGIEVEREEDGDMSDDS